MSNIIDLIAGADALNDSASDEGCDPSLIVVGSAELATVLKSIGGLKVVISGQQASVDADAEVVRGRLLRPDEFNTGAAIPIVADDAVAVIERLLSEMQATQKLLAHAIQQAEPLRAFVQSVAILQIWDYVGDDDAPANECEEPSDGTLDSHLVLMDNIRDARKLLAPV